VIVTREFQKAVRQWLKVTAHRKSALARLAECSPATVTRIFKQTGKRLDDAIADRICSLIEYDVPPIEGLCRKMLDRCDRAVGCFSEGRTLYMNSAMARLLGKTPEELIGQDLIEFIDPDCRSDALRRVAERDTAPYELTLLTPAGPKRLRLVPHMLTSHIRMIEAHELPPDINPPQSG